MSLPVNPVLPVLIADVVAAADEQNGKAFGLYSFTDSFDNIAVKSEGPSMPSGATIQAQLVGKDPVFHQLAGVYGASDNQGVMGLSTSASGTGVYGGHMGAGAQNSFGVRGETVGGVGVQGRSYASGDGVSGDSASGRGVVGHSGSQAGVVGDSDQFDGVYGVSRNPNAAGVSGHNPGGLAGFFDGNISVTGFLDGDLTVKGNVTVKGDMFLPGADCAEHFDTTDAEPLEPGSVVVIDRRGALRLSGEAYDKKAAGVVSGAGQYRPAIILDKQPSQNGRVALALVGKVYCKVDASYSSIDVGDLLTTSPTAGHAMKADDPLQAFGAIIGKALQPLASGQALIPILIALQ